MCGGMLCVFVCVWVVGVVTVGPGDERIISFQIYFLVDMMVADDLSE